MREIRNLPQSTSERMSGAAVCSILQYNVTRTVHLSFPWSHTTRYNVIRNEMEIACQHSCIVQCTLQLLLYYPVLCSPLFFSPPTLSHPLPSPRLSELTVSSVHLLLTSSLHTPPRLYFSHSNSMSTYHNPLISSLYFTPNKYGL